MEVSVSISTEVQGGFDITGNRVTHTVAVHAMDETEKGENDFDTSIRISHIALGTLAHTIGHLLSEEPEEVVKAALLKVGVDIDDDDDGSGGGGDDGGSWDNPMPPTSDSGDPTHGWNDGATGWSKTPPSSLAQMMEEALIGRIPQRGVPLDSDDDIPY